LNVLFVPEAWDQYQSWVSKGTIKTLVRINALIENCQRTPFEGIGKPEALRGNFAGSWSRRIDSEHRLIYAVTQDSEGEKALVILACRGHYN
jgi:toxin YoeB